jgi:predicted  nucleic acid-binding Zn-ribbon protein
MSSQDHDDGGVSFALPADVDDWLATEARRRGETRDDICRRLVTAAQTVATDDDLELADRAELVELRTRLETQRDEFADLLDDVRSRVIQVKQETDEKALADHDHPEYPTDDDLESIREEVAALEDTVESGFDNFETVLEELLEGTDDLAERSTLLARAVVDLRDQRETFAEQRRSRAAADDLKLAANRLGVRTATCADCASSVDIALLTAPECPHCASGFTDVDEKSSLFGSHRLSTGDPPALEGRADSSADSTSGELFEAVEADAEPGTGTSDEST